MSPSGRPPVVGVGEELARRGPVNRRDLIGVLLGTAGGAVAAGGVVALSVVELALADGPDQRIPATVGLLASVLGWLAGAVIALMRLVRRQRAWPVPLFAAAGVSVLGTLAALWWLQGVE